jgi:PAS domain S-box-containing protein
VETLPYIILAVGVSVAALATAIRFISLHHEPRNKVSVLILCGSIIWLLMSALVVASDNLQTKLLFYKMQFVGVVLVPALWLIVTMQVSGYERRVTRSNLVMLSVVPLVTLFLIFTNDWHDLMWSNLALNEVDPFLPFAETRGLGYWLLIVGYSYFVLLIAVVIFVRRVVISRSLYRRQAAPMMLVSCGAWSLSAAWFLNPSLFMYIDPTALALTVAASLTMWRLTYWPDIIPVAHEIVVDSMNEAVIILDAQNRIAELNPPGQELVGRSLSEALGQQVEAIWTDWPSVRKVLDSGTERNKEVSFGVGERRKVYELESSRLSGITSENPNLLVILRDITERKILDEKLRLYSEHLEDLVEERTKALREAERMAAMGEAAAMVGHDLRNPLQAMTNTLYLVKRLVMSEEAKDRKEAVGLVSELNDAIHYMDKIVSDLQDYARPVGAQPVETSLPDLIRTTVSNVKIPRNVEVAVKVGDGLSNVKLDPLLFRRVLTNLILNAVQAMPKGGRLTITGSMRDESLTLAVQDTGAGIAPQNLKRVFKPFFTTKAQGQGLGLSVCKRLTEAQGGTIEAASQVGEGSTFTLTMPTNRTPGAT